jgi:hypothetical protein
MRVRARLERLERHPAQRPADRGPPLQIWLPHKERDGRPPGRYACPGSNAVVVIYQADNPAFGEGDA